MTVLRRLFLCVVLTLLLEAMQTVESGYRAWVIGRYRTAIAVTEAERESLGLAFGREINQSAYAALIVALQIVLLHGLCRLRRDGGSASNQAR